MGTLITTGGLMPVSVFPFKGDGFVQRLRFDGHGCSALNEMNSQT